MGSVNVGDLIKVRLDKDNFIFDVEKTEMINVQVDKFHCQKCNIEFTTETIKNSTTICSKCGNSHVISTKEDPSIRQLADFGMTGVEHGMTGVKPGMTTKKL